MSPSGASAGRPAVFLDRDGTLLDEDGYRASPEGLRLLDGVGPALRALEQAGLARVVVTNQSGVARGLFDEETMERVNAAFEAELARAGARLDGIFSCPHLPPEEAPPGGQGGHGRAGGRGGPSPDPRYLQACACRKPAPGLLLSAAARLGLDLPRSWMVGDSLRDLEAGRAAGVAGLILVETGKGRAERARAERVPGLVFHVEPDLAGAARRILRARPEPARGREGAQGR